MELPKWILRKANQSDWHRVVKANGRKVARIETASVKDLKSWMQGKGWSRSWLFPGKSFFRQWLASEQNYQMALSEGVVSVLIPVETYGVLTEEITSIDEMYEERRWDACVSSLREYRWAIDAGVRLEIGDRSFTTSGAFYNWVHKRYPLLEEAADLWVLDDR